MEDDMARLKGEWQGKVKAVERAAAKQENGLHEKHQADLTNLHRQFSEAMDKKVEELQADAKKQMARAKQTEAELQAVLQEKAR
jgi:hypothetical protein